MAFFFFSFSDSDELFEDSDDNETKDGEGFDGVSSSKTIGNALTTLEGATKCVGGRLARLCRKRQMMSFLGALKSEKIENVGSRFCVVLTKILSFLCRFSIY